MKEIIITGHVGQDPEIRVNPQGVEFAKLSVGVYVKKDRTDWVEVSINGRDIDTVRNHIRKGVKVLIQGFPDVRGYINKKNEVVSVLIVYSNRIEILSRREETEPAVYNLPPIDQVATNDGSLTSDDIPF